jgi:L-threonylcarbamoyladenylate synthase
MGRVSVLPDPESEPAVDPSDEGAEAVEPAAEVDLGYRRWDCTGDDPELLARAEDDARAAIEAGECIVLPTDTVYGIGADAFNGDAVQGLLDAKVRGRDMPPPVLIGEPSLIRALATDIPDAARDLVSKHWPGPLTIILKRQPSLKMDLGDAEGTVALRVPDHELARDILRATGPMAVSSANISGLPAALTCDEAIDQLGASVSVYLDGGRLGENGQPPSTIVDFTQADHGQVLRRGALSVEVLRETLPDVEDLVDDEDPTGEEPTDEEPTDEEATGDGTTGDEPGEPDDVVDAEIVEEPDAEPGEESAADIRTQIENAEPETEAEPESASEPAPDSEPSPEVWHEPTTDELRITHPDHDIDQPDLFDSEQPDSEQPDSEQESPGDAPDSAGSRV